MRKLLGTIAWAVLLAAAFGPPALAEPSASSAGKDFLIRWNLFEGSKSKDAPASQVVLSTASKVPSVLQLSEAAKSPSKDLSTIQRELASIYQLESVQPLISNEWAWSRKNEKAINTLLLQEAFLPIAFTAQRRPGNQVNVRVQVSRVPARGISPALISNDLVDMEFLAKFKESMVVGFELANRPYFLAFEVLQADAPGSDPGVGSTIDEITFLPATRPVVQTLPLYPQALKAAGIGGTVVLRVDLDASGSVTRSEVLKGAQPDLDRIAREAVLGWKYEPVLKDGKAVPVSFSVSLSFNPDRPVDRSEQPEPKEPQAPAPANASPAEAPDPKLAGILDKAADYCEKLKRASLDFICREEVQEWTLAGQTVSGGQTTMSAYGIPIQKTPSYAGATNTRTNLLYDYQLIKDKVATTERRTLLEENGVKTEVKNAPLKTKRFYSVKGVYGPVGFLAREWRGQYDYKLLKDDKVDGRKAFVVEARPKTKIEGKPNFGKIWVDQSDFSVLRIDIEQESLPGFEVIAEQVRKSNFKPAFTISHLYGIEKNGLRFPSRTDFSEVYKKIFRDVYNSSTNKVTMSNTTIRYTDYKFFTVNVDVAY